jgi:hypothetical protein
MLEKINERPGHSFADAGRLHLGMGQDRVHGKKRRFDTQYWQTSMVQGSQILSIHKPIPIGSMVLEYLPTFALKITQLCS